MWGRLGLVLVFMGGLCSMGCDSLMPGPNSQDLLERFPTPIYSLTGEILNGPGKVRQSCSDAQAGWLKRISPAEDGINLEQLQAEAKLQFDRMDLNHDGIITAAELRIYRAPLQIVQEDSKDGRNIHRMPLRPHVSQPDPVLSADTNLDFQVTLKEFQAYQTDLFKQLDVNHHQKLTIREVAVLCQQREQAAHETNR